MIKNNTKFLALVLLLIMALTISACDANAISETEQSAEGEVIVDENTQSDVQKLMDALSLAEIDRTTANESVTRLRREGVESIASLRIIDDAEFAPYETTYDVNIMVEITNVDNRVFRASLSNSGQICAIYPPDKGAIIYGMDPVIL